MQWDGNAEERAVRRDWEEQRGSLRRGRAKNEGFPFFIKSVAQSLGCDLSSSIGPERRAIHKRNAQKAIKMHPLLSRGNYSFSSLRSVLFVIILLHAFFKTPTKRHSQTHSTVFINSMSSFPNSKRVYFLLLESKFSLNVYFHVSLRSPLKQCPKSQESFKQRLEEQCIKYSQKRRQVSNSVFPPSSSSRTDSKADVARIKSQKSPSRTPQSMHLSLSPISQERFSPTCQLQNPHHNQTRTQ